MDKKEYYFDKMVKNKKEIEKKVISSFSKDPLNQQFSKVFLNSFSAKALQNENSANLITFFKERFKVFKSTAENDPIKHIALNPILKTTSISDYSIEIIVPDARHLILTIENIFHKYNTRITKILHPLFSVYLNKNNQIILIDEPKKETQLISFSYIEFEFDDELSKLDDLKTEIEEKLMNVLHIDATREWMFKNLTVVQKEVAKYPTPRKEFHHEWIQLFDWLGNDNFTLLSYCELKLSASVKKKPEYINNSGLGILLDENASQSREELLNTIISESHRLRDYRSPFIFDRINFVSPVKIFENVMRLSLKIPQGKGTYIEYNFIGIFTKGSLFSKNIDTPLIKLKLNKILKNKQYGKGSYNYIQTIRFLNNTPKFELFRSPTENIQEIVEHLMSITNMNEVYVFTRKRIDKSKLFMMVVFPKNLYSQENIAKIVDYLSTNIPNNGVEFVTIDSDLLCRLHIYFEDSKNDEWYPDLTQLEKEIKSLINSWDNLFKELVITNYPREVSDELLLKYVKAIPSHHKARRTPENMLEDVYFLEKTVSSSHIQFNLKPFIYEDSVLSNKASVLTVYNQIKIDLATFIPVFQNLGLHFYDEVTARIGSIKKQVGYIHSYRIAHLNKDVLDLDRLAEPVTALLHAIFDEKIPNDMLNGLVVKANLTWQQVFIIQAYRNYLVQLTANYSKELINKTLLKHYESVKIIITYFEQKFIYHASEKPSKNRLALMEKSEKAFKETLVKVTDIREDFLLKWFFNLVKYTLRTNFYTQAFQENQLLSFKIDCEALQVPEPRPYREIFVFSPHMEGIHIRFGAVARGGIRWSNREDFRNEIIGLAHTQKVKNVVIVPTGSKGGFIIKKAFDKKDAATESRKHYESFITGLLMLTDNLDSNGKIEKPKQITCYDGDDPYIVVAADKGTATFSDYANTISKTFNFWLDDAFASGGSVGYNHKDYGITAKGAWECVKLHFKEKNKDIQKEPFSVVGVGDMSGDVFGNGMLLSKYIKLVAAFNHIHIFIDPDPDPAKSWVERDRLFKLPGSTWKEYDKNCISKGGGIFDRDSKKIVLSKEIMALLNINKSELNGNELINAILKIKADLLWFGGIGTYIKSTSQTQLEVRDPANNAIRIDTNECRCDVIGEGANLGMTQEARVKLSDENIQLNTDFIDNSAGVNMSDYEVNIKILLKMLERKNIIKSENERVKFLTRIGTDVVEKVLNNNIEQHVLISMESIRSINDFSIYRKLISQLVHNKFLDVNVDAIPNEATLDLLQAQNKPLPRSLLALVQAHIKINIYNELVASKLMEDPFLDQIFVTYFPDKLIKKYGDHVYSHPLKKEITAMLITNYIINRAGILFFPTIQDVLTIETANIAIAYIVVDYCFKLLLTRQNINNSDLTVKEKYHVLINIEDIIKTIVIDLISLPNFKLTFDLSEQISEILDLENKLLSLKLPHLAKCDDVLESLTAHQNISDIFYVTTINKSLDKKASIITSNVINDYLYFTKLKNIIRELTPVSQWDVEQQMMIKKVLQNKIYYIYDKIIENLPKKKQLTQQQIEEVINHTFKEKVVDYKETLEYLITNNEFSLTSVSVLVNKLNIF